MKNELEIEGLDEIRTDLNQLGDATEKALTELGKDIRFSWGLWVRAVDAVETYALAESIVDTRVSAHQVFVDTRLDASVIYSDIIERGRRGGTPGRYPAGKAIEVLDRNDFVEDRVTESLDRTLKQ